MPPATREFIATHASHIDLLVVDALVPEGVFNTHFNLAQVKGK